MVGRRFLSERRLISAIEVEPRASGRESWLPGGCFKAFLGGSCVLQVQVLGLAGKLAIALVQVAAVGTQRLNASLLVSHEMKGVVVLQLTFGPAGPSRTAQTLVPHMRQWKQRHVVLSTSVSAPPPP